MAYVEKSYRVQDEEVSRAITGGANYLLVGKRRFKIVEVAEVPAEPESYEVTDPEELRVLEEALNDKSRLLRGEEAREYLKARLREHGIR